MNKHSQKIFDEACEQAYKDIDARIDTKDKPKTKPKKKKNGTFTPSRAKTVIGTDSEGNKIWFPSRITAVKKMKTTKNKLRYAMERGFICAGYMWRYEDDS